MARKYESDSITRLRIRTTKLSSLTEIPRSTLRNNGYPHKISEIYDSITYKPYKGFILDPIDSYIAEREKVKEKRKEKEREKRKERINEMTENVEDIMK